MMTHCKLFYGTHQFGRFERVNQVRLKTGGKSVFAIFRAGIAGERDSG